MIDYIYTVIDPITKLTNGYLGEFNFVSIALRIILTFLFSAILGIERSNKRHSAGLRTFILMSLAGCFGALFDVFLRLNYGSIVPVVSAAILIGTAIVSSNTLLYSSKGQIKGLTTAAGLWANVSLGICFGSGLYTIGLIAFLMLLITLHVLPNLEVYLKNKSNHFEIQLELKNKTDLQNFTSTIRKLGLIIDDIESNPAYLNSGLSVYSVSLTIRSEELKKYKSHKEIIEALSTLEYVNNIEEMM